VVVAGVVVVGTVGSVLLDTVVVVVGDSVVVESVTAVVVTAGVVTVPVTVVVEDAIGVVLISMQVVLTTPVEGLLQANAYTVLQAAIQSDC